MKLRNSTCDKRLLGIFQNGSIQLLCIDLPWVPGLAPPMAHLQEAISLEFLNTPSVPPQVHWFNDFRFSMCLSGSSQLFRHLHKCYRVARAGLKPFPFALNCPQSRTEGCRQLDWSDAVLPVTSARRHYCGLQVCNWTEQLHFSSWSRSRTHPWTLYPGLWLCRMAEQQDFPLALQDFSRGKNPVNSRENPVSSLPTRPTRPRAPPPPPPPPPGPPMLRVPHMAATSWFLVNSLMYVHDLHSGSWPAER